jgi:hypothetical protein
MPNTRLGRLAMAVVLSGTAVSVAAADEVVHFTNGAEMTIRSHVVEKDMLKLDLGGNNAISFPVSMVGKIVSAGQDVFLNPVYYPANQALAAGPNSGSVVADYSNRGSANPSGREGEAPGAAGWRLGEGARTAGAARSVNSNPHDDMETAGRPRFDPLKPLAPGGVATIDPTSGLHQVRLPAKGMIPRTDPTPAPPAAQPNPQPIAPQGGEPQTPGGEDSGGNDTGNQDSPPNL